MIKKFTVKGLVQGIGYRPWVARLAEELNIEGTVRNTGGIVTIIGSGDEEQLKELYNRLSVDVPTGGFVNSIEMEDLNADESYSGFRIIQSDQDIGENLPLIPADIATCQSCKKELLDSRNRRYLHPFISCTICGPRYSILERLPYDRDSITMDDFEMCPECAKEYTAKDDIRRHAQTIACKNCGPKLAYKQISGVKIEDNHNFAGNPAKAAVHRKFTSELLDNLNDGQNGKLEDNLLQDLKNSNQDLYNSILHIINGGILALKDIGGYHLVCDPFNEEAVAKLRILKHREAKAFAVMFYDIEQIKEYCEVDDNEAKLLESPPRPIVLLKRIYESKTKLADNVCLTSPSIGAMLPSNPVQIILTRICGPLIMTSGNASGDVLETDDANMEAWLTERAKSEEMSGVSMAMLSNNRRILRPMDDSVMKVVKGRQQFIRRGRGHVPSPIPVDIKGELFATGGDLKSSFCYIKNGLAYVSQYLGDMESVSCQRFYRNEKEAMTTIFGFKPDKVVVDKHPGYFSRKTGADYAKDQLSLTEVQHHKAHVAAVIAEHNLQGQVLGFAFDGTGYGDDGSIWGSEVFAFDGESTMERVAHLKPMKLIGGDEGAKNCDTILTAMLYGNAISRKESTAEEKIIAAALDNNINTVTSTSMGRLFDAVSALLGVCHYNSYEGQAPIELENVAATTKDVYPLSIGVDGDTKKLFTDIVNAIEENVDKAAIARGFIHAVSDYIQNVTDKIAGEKNIHQVVLSGGTFLNSILLENVITNLEDKGYEVYIAELLPPGDGGICLGQAYLSQIE
ncbi:MAG: carbamoyltransferase HypF [Pseudobutyrivibrio sp.]|nr:carbamoyltransferase HypF [Pseudobutyrivibrio sp.]